jgi:hypothetical protein
MLTATTGLGIWLARRQGLPTESTTGQRAPLRKGDWGDPWVT